MELAHYKYEYYQVVSLMYNPLPGGPGDCALSGFYLSTFRAWLTVPVAMLLSAKLTMPGHRNTQASPPRQLSLGGLVQ